MANLLPKQPLPTTKDGFAHAVCIAPMLLLLALLSLGMIACAEVASASTRETFDQSTKPHLRAFPAPPLAFVPNAGQLDPAVRYYGRVQGYSVYFAPQEVVLAFEKRTRATTRGALPADEESSEGVALALTFLGSRPGAQPQGQGEETAKVNVLRGNDPSKWQTGLPTYREIVYPALWPGVDLVFKRADGRLKYEFLVHPGARAQSIQVAYRGAESLVLDPAGDLLIRTALGVLTDERPTSYQVVDGRKVPVETRFALASNRTDAYGFVLGAGYDARYPLVIDPGFQAGDFSTILSGIGTDIAHAIAVTSASNCNLPPCAYVVGQTDSADFPITVGPIFMGGSKSHGFSDAFIAKLDSSGNPIFVTYLGGNDADVAVGVAVDSAGNPYVTGYTYSSNFPTTAGAFSVKIRGGSDAFVTKLDGGTGLVLYSTFLGGGGFDSGEAITVDSSGSAYVTGQTLSSNFPITPGAFSNSQGKSDAFVTKFTPDGKNVVYSTYLGGTGDDIAYGIAVDDAGNAYVTGETSSPNFPTRAPPGSTPLRSSFGGVRDAFVTKVNSNGSGLIFSTYLGGSGDDVGYGIALRQGDDLLWTALVTGATNSSNFPTPSGTVGAKNSFDAFVVRMNASGSGLIYSTLLGGTGDDHGFGIALDNTGAAYIVGDTASADLPVTEGTFGGSTDAFVAKLSANGNALLYATFLGGSGPDSGNGIALGCVPSTAGSPADCAVWVAGQTASANFPIFPTPSSGSIAVRGVDAFVAKLHAKLPTTTTLLSPSPFNSTVFGQSVTFTALVTATPPSTGIPSGTVTFKDGGVPIGTGTLNGGSATLTIKTLSVTLTVPPAAPLPPHSITAEYGGDTIFLGSISPPPPLTQTVAKASTTVSLAVSPSAPTSTCPSGLCVGTPLTLNANVTVNTPGSGTPTGTVTFQDGDVQLGTQPLSAATLSTTPGSNGPHNFTATYSGDSNFAGSGPNAPPGGPVTIQATTTTSIMASTTTTTFGQTITFTATVSPSVLAAGTPTGTVTFKDYGVVIGTGTLDATGKATLTTGSLGIGLHSITATFGGSANYATSTSAGSDSGILLPTVISAPTVVSTNRTGANALYASCNSQFVTITGTNFLPPTAFPTNLIVGFAPPSGITIKEIAFISGTTLGVQVDVANGATGSRVVTVTNPDTGMGTSPTAILDVGNPNPCPAIGLAPSNTPSGTATAPVISSLVPASGLRGGTVTVNGSNFGSAPVVTFTGPGNSPVIATIKTSSSSSLTVTVPAFPSTTADAFDGPVFVTNSSLASNGANFTVTNPRLSVVTPASAPPGSVALDLAGAKLQSGANVQFFNAGTTTPAGGITVASVASDGTGQHLAVGLLASAATGLLDAVVTNPDGGSTRLPGAFQVKAAPAASFAFTVGAADPASFLPSVDAVLVTLDATGKCTAKTITPHGVSLSANFTTTVGALPPSSVTFTITSVSNLPGTATNEDCELGTTPTNDFSIGAPSVTSQQVTIPGSGTYQTTLYSYDWGGKVTIAVSGVTTVNGTSQTVTSTLTLPVDTDSDGLPDAHELNAALNTNAAGQNVLDWRNGDQDGNGVADGDDRFAKDGLSNFEKYRGVYLSGPTNGSTGQMIGLTRLGAGLRHLFVRGRGFADDPAIQTAPGTCGIDPATGVPQPDLSPCPAFQVGAAFVAAGVQVHNVSASFAGGRTFPRQSLATPANPTLDMATITYDGVNCSAYGCSTSKTGARNWTFSSLGFSSYGTLAAYGSDARITKKALDAYFNDRPYQRRTDGLTPCTASSTTPCYVVNGTTAMLTPMNLVGDSANDNGIKDSSKEVVNASGQLVGDTYVPGPLNLDLSAMDTNNDGCVELPFVGDPRSIPRCPSPTADSALSPQATKQQAARHLITHELGHAVGINTHTTDATDVMYQSTINWIRDGHFSPAAAGLLQIHNKGLQ